MYWYRFKKMLLFFAGVVSITALQAQPEYFDSNFRHTKDSLISDLKKFSSTDTLKANTLFKIVDCAIYLAEKKEVMPYWEEGMQISQKLNFTKGIVGSLSWKGVYYKSAKVIDSALIFLDSAIVLANHFPDKNLQPLKGFAFLQKGMIYENRENYYVALKNYFESLKNYGTSELINRKSLFEKIAHIYQQLNNDEKALEYYRAILKLVEKEIKSSSNNHADGTYTSIATIYFERNDLNNAKYYLDKLKPVMPDTVETIVTGGYYSLAGKIALKEKKNDTAFIFLKEALKYYTYTRQMHKDEIANIFADIGRLKLETCEISEAKDYIDQSLEAARESSHKKTMANSLMVMAAYYNQSGNQSGAYTTLQQPIILNDSVLVEANIKQANTLAAIYENDKKEKAIAQLQADKIIQAATVKQKSLLNIIFIITIAALLFTGFLFYRNFSHKQKLEQQRITELEKEKKLLAVEAMLKGQEEERTRLAKDLHDGLGGMLSGVKISFSNMKENMIMDAAHAASFEKSLHQLDSTIAELRKVAHNLMPEALVKFGLKSAVKDFCDSMQLRGNTEIICEQLGDERELGNIADVNVYRIIQELVNNAAIHGTANQILVQISKTPNKVLITVEDSGNGFDLNELKKSKGIGLSNIKHRVDYLNGSIDLDSKPGEGTTVNIELTA